jgi:hypothetical protein
LSNWLEAALSLSLSGRAGTTAATVKGHLELERERQVLVAAVAVGGTVEVAGTTRLNLITRSGTTTNKQIPGSRLRPDALDPERGIIRELKPNSSFVNRKSPRAGRSWAFLV